MVSRTTRPTTLQPLNIPTIVIHRAESTGGLTPRTPYSQGSGREMLNQNTGNTLQVYLSPSSSITPVWPRIPRSKSVEMTATKLPQPGRGWHRITWSTMLVLFGLALWSLRLCKINYNSHPPTPPNTYNKKPMEWITIKPHKVPITPAIYPMQTPTAARLTEAEN